jgi:hypothetical protein
MSRRRRRRGRKVEEMRMERLIRMGRRRVRRNRVVGRRRRVGGIIRWMKRGAREEGGEGALYDTIALHCIGGTATLLPKVGMRIVAFA